MTGGVGEATRLVLDARAWALLVRAVGVSGLPPEFEPGTWAVRPDADGEGVDPAGSDVEAVEVEAVEAWGRLERAGVVAPVAGGSGVGGSGVRRVVHRGVLMVLAGLVAAPVRVSVRAWSGEREVLVELGVVAGRGAGLVRRRVLDGAGRVVGDEPWVELAEFDAGSVVDEVLRGLPAGLTGSAGVNGSAGGDGSAGSVGESVKVGWSGSLAVARAFRTGRVDLVGAVVGLEGEQVAAGLRSPLLREAIAGLRGGVEVSVIARGRVADGGVGVVGRWVGTWLDAEGGPLSLALVRSDGESADAQEDDPQGDDVPVDDVGEPLVRLCRVSAVDVRADLVLALTAALDAVEAASEVVGSVRGE